MKLATTFGLFVAALSLTAVAQAADLTGTWTYVSQACASGAPPNPAAGEPNGTLTFQNNQMSLKMLSQGCTIEVGPAAVTITDDKITPLAPTTTLKATCGTNVFTDVATVSTLTYTLAADLLTLKSEPFQQPNQTCAVGDSQIITVRKTL